MINARLISYLIDYSFSISEKLGSKFSHVPETDMLVFVPLFITSFSKSCRKIPGKSKDLYRFSYFLKTFRILIFGVTVSLLIENFKNKLNAYFQAITECIHFLIFNRLL